MPPYEIAAEDDRAPLTVLVEFGRRDSAARAMEPFARELETHASAHPELPCPL
jgi:hypothetical protein